MLSDYKMAVVIVRRPQLCGAGNFILKSLKHSMVVMSLG